MNNEIEKSEQPNPDDILAAIQSFNDPNIITNMFRELGWTYSVEIKETLVLAKQNANLSIKFKAIKYLRDLIREAAEAAGYVANVSKTIPNAQGGQTTFHAKRIAGALNPVKKIESKIKELPNGKKEPQKSETEHHTLGAESDRESDRGQSKKSFQTRESADSSESIRDTRRAFPLGDADSGGTEPPDGGETPGRSKGRDDDYSDKNCNRENSRSPSSSISSSSDPRTAGSKERVPPDRELSESNDSPCINTRPPTCDRDLFPGISSAEE